MTTTTLTQAREKKVRRPKMPRGIGIEGLRDEVLRRAGLNSLPTPAEVFRKFDNGSHSWEKLDNIAFIDNLQCITGRYSEDVARYLDNQNVKMCVGHNKGAYVVMQKAIRDMADILKNGLNELIIVNDLPEFDELQVVSGRHRSLMFYILYGGKFKVPVSKMQISIEEAPMVAYQANMGPRKAGKVEKSCYGIDKSDKSIEEMIAKGGKGRLDYITVAITKPSMYGREPMQYDFPLETVEKQQGRMVTIATLRTFTDLLIKKKSKMSVDEFEVLMENSRIFINEYYSFLNNVIMSHDVINQSTRSDKEKREAEELVDYMKPSVFLFFMANNTLQAVGKVAYHLLYSLPYGGQNISFSNKIKKSNEEICEIAQNIARGMAELYLDSNIEISGTSKPMPTAILLTHHVRVNPTKWSFLKDSVSKKYMQMLSRSQERTMQYDYKRMNGKVRSDIWWS